MPVPTTERITGAGSSTVMAPPGTEARNEEADAAVGSRACSAAVRARVASAVEWNICTEITTLPAEIVTSILSSARPASVANACRIPVTLSAV